MKKGRIILALLALLFAGMAAAQQISYIESDGNWHRLYDAKGKKIGGFARSSVGEVVGWGSTFFVGKNTGFYRIFDVKGRVKASQSISTVGEVLSVTAETIMSRKGNWILIWDKNFKKVGSRPAQSR